MFDKDQIETLGSFQAREQAKTFKRFGTVTAHSVQDDPAALLVQASVKFFGTVGVTARRSGAGPVVGTCSRCGKSTQPNLCGHVLAALMAVAERGDVGGVRIARRFHVDIDPDAGMMTCTITHDDAASAVDPAQEPDAVKYALTTRCQFQDMGRAMAIKLRGYGAQAACKDLLEGFAPLAEHGTVVPGPHAHSATYHRMPDLELSLKASGSALRVRLSSALVAPDEMPTYAECCGYTRIWWDPVCYCPHSNAFVGCDQRVARIFDFLAFMGIAPAQAARSTYLPVAAAFRAKAALDNLFADVRVDTSALDAFLERALEAGETGYAVPAQLDGTLKPWQVDGFNRLQQSYHMGLGGLLLADGMGLGKTIQTIAHICAVRRDEPEVRGPVACVICPSGLVFNWVHEFELFAPQLRVLRVAGGAAERLQLVHGAADTGSDVVVTSYDSFWRDHAAYLVAGWDLRVLVADEAQFIKNAESKRARAVKALPARQRIALTGTPIENGVADAYSIFEFVTGADAGYLGSRAQFLELRRGLERGNAAQTRFFRDLVRPYTLRRTVELLGLPPLQSRTRYVEMDPESQRVYDLVNAQLLDMLRAMSDQQFKDEQMMVLTKLLRLRQCAFDTAIAGAPRTSGPSAKMRALVEMLSQARANGQKALVFTDLVAGFAGLGAALEEADVPFMVLTGGVPPHRRELIVERFNSPDDDTVALLAGLKTGGLGLNIVGPQEGGMPLTTVIHATPWWNPAARDQATARAYRLGQSHEIDEVNLVCAGTIEEHVCAVQRLKESVAEDVFGSTELERARLTRKELIELLSRSVR